MHHVPGATFGCGRFWFWDCARNHCCDFGGKRVTKRKLNEETGSRSRIAEEKEAHGARLGEQCLHFSNRIQIAFKYDILYTCHVA